MKYLIFQECFFENMYLINNTQYILSHSHLFLNLIIKFFLNLLCQNKKQIC